MRVEDVEKELQRRKNIINKILSQDMYGDKEQNEYIKNNIENNYTNIRVLYGDSDTLTEMCYMISFGMNIFRRIDNFHEIEIEAGVSMKELLQKIFFDIFDNRRAIALVNILQPINTKVYQKEGISSLQFEKGEILKGFSKDEIEKEGITELTAKLVFWINKLTKLSQLMEIHKLKSRPITRNSDENYLSAKKRSEILYLFEDLCDADKKIMQDEIADRYEETFGVKIEDDIKTLKEIKKVKSFLYNVKNTLMTDLLIKYFESIKRGKELPGVQGMGVKVNEVGLADSVGSYLAVIRLKGYTSNIYLHVPSFCFAEAVDLAKADKLPVLVPKTIYSTKDPNRVVPVNVICKVEKGTKRYEAIKKEAETNKGNEIIKQAFIQVKGKAIPGHNKSDWERKTIERIPLG